MKRLEVGFRNGRGHVCDEAAVRGDMRGSVISKWRRKLETRVAL